MNVLQEWTNDIPLKMQAILISAIRRPDIGGGGEVTNVVRWLRYHVLIDGNKGRGTFLLFEKKPTCTKEFMNEFVTCSMHFSLHILHAYEVIGRMHSEAQIRATASDFYCACCHAMHVNPETYAEMLNRLDDNHEANCWK